TATCLSVLSRDRPVSRLAPSTSQTQRSRQGRNQLRLLARPIQSRLPHRSMSASTIRPVPHSIPLLLSIAAMPHDDGLMRSRRADSLCLRVARSRNYPMLPYAGTVSVETPEISGQRAIVHFILFLLCFYFGFISKPKQKISN